MRRHGQEVAAALAAAAMLAAAIAPRVSVAAAPDPTVNASACSVAGGRDASHNTLTCNFGLTPEQLREVTKAAVEGATEPLLGRMEKIGRQLGVTEDAAKTLLRIVGEQADVPDERLAEVLTRVALDYKRLQTQVAALNPDNPTARDLVDRAKAEIAAGRFEVAHQLLAQARQAQIAAAQEAQKLADQAQAARDSQLLGAAASAATEGDLAMTELRYAEAADLFGQAAKLVPSGHADEAADYRERQADALYREGDEHGKNAALTTSIETWRLVLQQRTRERVPLQWAATQNNLGNALWTLGEREQGTARLEQAAAAFRAALEEYTRERVPLQWAMTQNNLGNALWMLGEREQGTARLEQAAAAFRAALEVFAEARTAYYMDGCRSNLDRALALLAERKG